MRGKLLKAIANCEMASLTTNDTAHAMGLYFRTPHGTSPHHVFEILQFSASKPSTAREVRGIVTTHTKAHCGSSRCSRARYRWTLFLTSKTAPTRAYPTAMIWPVQNRLAVQYCPFPKRTLLRVPACFRGEWCSGGARKRVYVKYHLFWCIFPQLNSTHRCRVPAPDAISYNHSDIKQS